jgi:hypothetical protein
LGGQIGLRHHLDFCLQNAPGLEVQQIQVFFGEYGG